MATARERLLQALTDIMNQPLNEEGKSALRRLLNSYRVQAKPGEDVDKTETARTILANKLIEVWHKDGGFDKKTFNQVISLFRMQIKQGLNRGRVDTKADSISSTDSTPDVSKTMSRSQIKENTARQENAYFKNRVTSDATQCTIAGGPKHGTNSRGQCPKCRSMGIVLARAYGGDDYYSCIYCGFQSYAKGMDPKLDLPLAAELLGRFSKTDGDED